ncbi:interleukin-1 receptor-associated kinase 3 isoform X2 [Micropterus dolomieu]|uniref:interleukin-1 receptor-associated kinase 3 isoform X1 n=1 Tax=Micropterus dolomieu TaxID=147949 RepID=UPI001E8E3BD5|nr:interleukin-1 receptor-associated kinase 3 isoform X1 [Micropterus dolomieu]XP_045928605.1 interleukin-1 receptor-associated kinase 3 isoform X2 [Micropterus dolomieu]
MDASTLLYDVPPAVVQRFCEIMDSGDDRFGWRGLAVRVVPSLLEVRMLERMETAGRSPTRELLWSWAQQNSTVRDLVKILQDMGHLRALQLFRGQAQESPSPHSNPHAESTGKMSAAQVKESFQLEASSSSPTLCPVNSINFQDIVEGTRHFHDEMRIAEGPFSDVYRAQMGSRTFAVKVFKQINQTSWKKLWDIFRKEVEIHHLYQHPNILDLCCFSGEDRYCLVYPYLPNGSLFHRLHHQDGKPPLSWQERLTIIKGIAKALHHLHTAQPCPVICGNISSANILLDDALQARLSDFELAHLRPHSANQNCTVTLDTGPHSDLGYLPEEYIRDGKLSFSLDVYSFGMVTMETVTGRKVIEDVPKHTQLRDLLVSEVEDSGGVDSCLQYVDVAAGRWPTAVALSLLGLALDCTASRHRNRPSMENVLLALSKLLPPPSCPPADQPHSLDSGAHINPQQSPLSSIPVEHDEQQSLPCSPTRAGPCECSQSEVTYLSDTVDSHGEVDLYCSWPVQCSCTAENGSLACEDCRANSFILNHRQGSE